MENQTSAQDRPDIYSYLQQLHEQGGSDLFLSVGTAGQIKVEGITRPVNERQLRPGDAAFRAPKPGEQWSVPVLDLPV